MVFMHAGMGLTNDPTGNQFNLPILDEPQHSTSQKKNEGLSTPSQEYTNVYKFENPTKKNINRLRKNALLSFQQKYAIYCAVLKENQFPLTCCF